MEEGEEEPRPQANYTTRYGSIFNVLDPSLVVNNEGSVARDHLSNERNFLAWFRLSITLIIIGFTVMLKFRFHREGDDEPDIEDPFSKPIGIIFVVIGLTAFILGIFKFIKNQRLLTKQKTLVQAGWGSFLIAGVIVVFVCGVMIIATVRGSLFVIHG
ncbi:hypothetical protein BC937DRAFT_93119 [Endogone sp. FLAS-F59071]|nr:hypothetical protein BC937DRAFT_93119 [Endogone sp. FLAS-F59071]|eukprot:RUS14950.1 hypothetical protein BC937DRAFT_93119 [Endogone sp. FLAS-F59071]